MRVKRGSNDRGLVLAATLVFMVVMFIGAVALGTIAINNLTTTKIASNSTVAMQAAEAGLSVVMDRLNTDADYCTDTSGTLNASNASWATTFWDGSGQPNPEQSVNNIGGMTYITRTDGSRVPPWSVDVIITTNVQSPNKNIPKVGCIMTNLWDTAIASTGTFSATGNLNVKGASSLDVVAQILAGTTNGDVPGRIGANSTGNPSVSFNTGIVTGYVKTPGTPDIPNGTTWIQGTTAVPQFTWSFLTPNMSSPEVAAYAPNAVPSNIQQTGSKTIFYVNGNVSVNSLDLDGVTLCVNGNLTVNGGLNMRNAVLYTNGDCTIKGGIKDGDGKSTSTGGIYVCGANSTLSVAGASQFASSNTNGVALYSQGNIALTGGAQVQGVAYANGNVTAKGGAQFVGVVLANGNTSSTMVGVTGGATFIFCRTYAQQFSESVRAKMTKLSWRIIDRY